MLGVVKRDKYRGTSIECKIEIHSFELVNGDQGELEELWYLEMIRLCASRLY